MAKKNPKVFRCAACGSVQTKWAGKCPECGAWSSLEESEALPPATGPRGLSASGGPRLISEISGGDVRRIKSGNPELDRTLGGGFAPGSLLLVGGDPGIGKSTLLLQTSATLAAAGLNVLYASGEESAEQIKLRAMRLGVGEAPIRLLCETSLSALLEQARKLKPEFLVVDSIQTLFKEELPGTPGSVAQIRECTLDLMNFAKSAPCVTVIVGHVTKEGQIAGPRVLEHMVDTVVYFEGDRDLQFRVIRTVKNRFGSTNEIGVFEMQSCGLVPVSNPSALFLQQSGETAPGSVVSCAVEGTRALMFEVQALVASAGYSTGQRVALGLDGRKLAILLALLERYGGMQLGNTDVFASVAGGLKIDDTATDLAVALAVAGNLRKLALPARTVALGELGLGGEVRPVSQIELRLQEAARLGFERAVVPAAAKLKEVKGLELLRVKRLDQALALLE